MANLNSNFQISGNVTLNGVIPDISISSVENNALIKKDDGYYVASSPVSNTQYCVVDSIADLKNLEPNDSIVHVTVRSFNKGTQFGGGEFYYDSLDKRSTTDNATIIVTPKGARWKKVICDASDLNVTHFGAVPDGVTDCSAACLAMHNWSQKNNVRVGIQFPSGTFKLNGFDISSTQISHFRMVGAMVSFGYFPATTLVSDRGTGTMVSVKARWTEVANFYVDGESLKDNGPANTKAFFKNGIYEGQYVRISNMQFRYLGGLAISLLDTLDTKIDQFYAGSCTGGIVCAGWSDVKSWNHSTAIEITNFNIQSNTGPIPVFDMQRCTQAILRNGWIEKTTTPGDLSNGQWIIDALSMEGCVTPLNLTYCRYVMTQKNMQGTSNFTTTDSTKTNWLSIWEAGTTEIENFGIRTSGSMNYGFLTSENRFSNNANLENWFKLGDLFIPNDGDTVNIRLIGTLGFSSSLNTNEVGNGRHGNGEAIIRLQKKAGGVGMTWEGLGACPVVDVMYVSSDNKTDCSVYVKLGKYVMNTVAVVETSAKDRYYAGICFRWTFDGSKMDEATVKAIPNIAQAIAQASWSAGNNGIVLSSDGSIGIKTLPIENNQLPIYINGVLYKIALTK